MQHRAQAGCNINKSAVNYFGKQADVAQYESDGTLKELNYILFFSFVPSNLTT